jgi:hypothetical protein
MEYRLIDVSGAVVEYESLKDLKAQTKKSLWRLNEEGYKVQRRLKVWGWVTRAGPFYRG